MRQLWMRAGINLNLSAEEADAILAPGASAEAIEAVVKNIILEGRFSFSGESYIPQPCVEQFNDAYGTEYKADDIDFEVNLEAIPMPKEESADEESQFKELFRKFCRNTSQCHGKDHECEVCPVKSAWEMIFEGNESADEYDADED